jgi:Ca-activated chloride channel family protein
MEYRRGLDVVFALDISRSMEVEDVLPQGTTRLERGLSIARELVSAVPEIRFAAAIGKGKGMTAVPLTWDTEAVLSFLEGLSGLSLSGRGTDLESLLDTAAGAFQNSSPAKRVIVLISDGEALSGSLRNALDRRAGEGVIVAALSLGSDEGGPVPKIPGEDADDEIISRRDSSVMRYAAERTGGIYIDGNGDNDAGRTASQATVQTVSQTAAQLAGYLKALAPESESLSPLNEPKSRRQIFILAAILFYGISKLCLLRVLKSGTPHSAGRRVKRRAGAPPQGEEK